VILYLREEAQEGAAGDINLSRLFARLRAVKGQ